MRTKLDTYNEAVCALDLLLAVTKNEYHKSIINRVIVKYNTLISLALQGE